MDTELRCWRCGASLAALSLPLGRTEECAACRSPLHVCRLCRFFDCSRPKQCREDDAEEVREKERPNFCDYFKPHAGAFDAQRASAEQAAMDAAAALFGPKQG
ncbi:MAG: hypothetical protein KJ049_00675 [Gammaproteobacteria bacterium]|nr:hypothetical protein [Gammaproteobacteria bacterium]